MAERQRVAVLLGGRSAEREVSLKSGAAVLAALGRRGVDAFAFDPSLRPLSQLRGEGATKAFIALHGRFGEDGTVQGALELLDIPYTGSGVTASAVAIDKVMTKRLWLAQGLPTPRYAVVRAGDGLSRLADELGLPLFVKPPHEGSTIGVTKVTAADQIDDAVAMAARFDETALAEEFIEGPELTVAILGSGAQARALPVVEIRAPQGNYDYEHKYLTNDTQYLCPAPLPESLTREIQRLALEGFRSIGCTGWARVDFMLRRRDHKPFLIEINTSPGMTDHSLVPMAARAEGIEFDELVMRILAEASLQVRRTGA